MVGADDLRAAGDFLTGGGGFLMGAGDLSVFLLRNAFGYTFGDYYDDDGCS